MNKKREKKLPKNISYILKFIDSARFIASSLPNLVDNVLKEFIKLNVSTDTIIKGMKIVELHTKYETSFLTTTVISLFYCCQNVFIPMNIWMIGKNSMKHDLVRILFLKLMFIGLKNYMTFTMIYHFYLKDWILK